MKTALRAWYYRALVYVDQFKDEAPACCGTCRACTTATAGAVTGLLISSIRRKDLSVGRTSGHEAGPTA
jgi:hypothetical protein